MKLFRIEDKHGESSHVWANNLAEVEREMIEVCLIENPSEIKSHKEVPASEWDKIEVTFDEKFEDDDPEPPYNIPIRKLMGSSPEVLCSTLWL